MTRPLLERSALELAGAIRRGELTAAEVVAAHVDRHRRTRAWLGAIVVDRFEEAQREAAAVDTRVARARAAGRTSAGTGPGGAAGASDLPPLLGVPFTVKESIALEGMPHSAGLVARQALRVGDSAPSVQRLIDAGAIPLGVTNTSELTLWIESGNRLYGRTSNPYDRRRTAGGSSGGEGAAVGSGGSVFGVASDIAGSIRIPAFFCGSFGHKPSPGLVSNEGLYPPAPQGQAERLLQTGPLARRAEDLLPLLRTMAVAGAPLGDPATVSLEGMPVTVLENTALLPMSRELRDARERALGTLAAAGAAIRRIELRSWRRATLPFLATLQAGSTLTTGDLLEAAGVPRPTWGTVIRRGGPHTLATRIALAGELLPPARGPALERQLSAGRALAAELTDAIGDGVLLHPPHPRVAPPHGTTTARLWLLTPAAMFNLAGVPVTEVPLGLSANGLPLGIQVAAGSGRDHVAIAVALELERVFGGWVPPWAAPHAAAP